MPHSKGTTGQTRKVLAFYRVNFKFMPPFHVLCDADIIHEALKKDLYLKQTLPAMLAASTQPVVTSCVIRDLRGRGTEYSSAALFAKRVTRLPCNHEGTLPAADCVLRRLESQAEPKVFVAAANGRILKQIAGIPGIPLISIMNQTKLALRPPNKATLNHVLHAEKKKTMAISDADKALLARITEAEKASKPVRTITRRHKKAKGPNPLSVKKSKKLPESNGSQQAGHGVLRREESDQKEHSGERQLESKADSKAIEECAVSLEKNHPSSNGKRKRRRRRQPSDIGAVNNAKVLETGDPGDTRTLSPPKKVRRRNTDLSSSGAAQIDQATDPDATFQDGHQKQSRTRGSENGINGQHVGVKNLQSLKAADRYDQEEKQATVQNVQRAQSVSDRFIHRSENNEQITSPKTETVDNCTGTADSGANNGNYRLQLARDAGGKAPMLEQNMAKRKKQRKNRRRRPQKKGS